MKIAVVGVGRMGRRHLQAAAKAGYELCGVYDISAASLDLARREEGVPDAAAFDDLDRMYASARPDCVIVATTADSHAFHTARAVEAGAKYVLVEKPMAVSLAECDNMIGICDRAGVKLAVNHQMRFMEQYTRPKALAESPAFGGLASMTVVAGNFGMAMNGTHYFEAFRFVAGEPIHEVQAWFSADRLPNPRGPQFEDRAGSIRATTAGGRRFYMDASPDQGHGLHVVYGCRNGTIVVDELTGEMWCSAREEQFRGLPTTRYAMPAVSERVAIRPAEVIDTTVAVLHALTSGVNSVNGADGRRAVEVLVAAHRSAALGGAAVNVDEIADRSEEFPWA